MKVDQLAPDEPLSPELVLVLPEVLRAQVLAGLGPQTWPRPPLRVVEFVDRPVRIQETFARSLGSMLVTRVVQLTVIFIAVTALTVVMAQIAHAVR